MIKRTRRLLILLFALTLSVQAANELTGGVNFTFNKNGAIFQRASSVTVTITGAYTSSGVASITTTDGTLPLGNVGTIGYVFLHNLDGTNYITIGTDGTNYPLKLKPGECCLVRWNAAAVHAKANTASCKLEFGIIED